MWLKRLRIFLVTCLIRACICLFCCDWLGSIFNCSIHCFLKSFVLVECVFHSNLFDVDLNHCRFVVSVCCFFEPVLFSFSVTCWSHQMINNSFFSLFFEKKRKLNWWIPKKLNNQSMKFSISFFNSPWDSRTTEH